MPRLSRADVLRAIGIGLATLVSVGAIIAEVDARTPSAPAIYSSMPLVGEFRSASLAIVRGARLALRDHAPAAVRYVSLNSGSRRARSWDPARTARNAHRAAADPTAVAYIGELNSAASAISLPILNHAGLAQISPANTAIGLTRGGPGAAPGEPGRYYPTGMRHYFRLVPNDRLQGAALARLMRQRGCQKIGVIDDGRLYGRGLAVWTRRGARDAGMRISLKGTVRGAGAAARLAGRLRQVRADCATYTGLTTEPALALFREVGSSLPRARLFGSDWVTDARFAAGLSTRLERRVLLTTSVRQAFTYPRSGRRLLRRLGLVFHDPDPDPWALYGYEAMRLVLDTLTSGAGTRGELIRSLAEVRARQSVIGSYGFDGHGDTTQKAFGVYRPAGRSYYFVQTLRVRATPTE
jgi:branched-chain amino acid transport system substrate-binding protein